MSAHVGNNDAPMDVTLAVLADFASVTREGKLNILGIFHEINPANFPTVLPIFYIVVAFEAGPMEAGSAKHTEIILHDADGGQKMRIQNDFEVPPASRPGRRSGIHQINAIIQLRFENSGDYQFVIMVNGEEKGSIPLRVNEPQEANNA